MTKKIVLSAIAASVMATSAMATYGSTMLGLTAKDRAMGGTGIASANGASSVTLNPAMIAGAKEEVSANIHYMMIDVTASNNAASTTYESETDTSIIPTVLYVKPINKNLTIGAGFFGAAGMGVNYDESGAAVSNMKTSLAIAKLVVPVAYKTGALSVGITPVIAQGSLSIQYDATGLGGGPFAATNDDTAFGFEAGVSYDVNKELTVAALYKSAISLEYTGVINGTSGAAQQFGLSTVTDELEQASEMGVGVSYKMGASTINFDYKTIAWSDAAGYKDFNWEDQDIVSIGYEYKGSNWAARVGYSFSDSPIADREAVVTDDATDVMNAWGFPATPDTHITFGGAYDVSKQMTVEAAVILASAETVTSDASTQFGGAGLTTVSSTNDQTNITIGVNYKF